MKIKIVIILLYILVLGSCGKEPIKDNIDRSNLIDTSLIKVDVNDFKKSSEDLKVYVIESNNILDNKIGVLKEESEKKVDVLRFQYSILVQNQINKKLGKTNEIVQKLEQELSQKEEKIFYEYQKNIRKLENEQNMNIEKKVKMIDDKNLKSYEEKKKIYVEQELQKLKIQEEQNLLTK